MRLFYHKYPRILQIIEVVCFTLKICLPHISILLVKTFEAPLLHLHKSSGFVPLGFKMVYRIFSLPK